MSKDFKVEGTVVKQERGNHFLVECQFGTIQAYLGGPIIKNKIKVIPGDSVEVIVSPYDTQRGRIVKRL
jgi:translation initiation factor IF-1